MYTTKTELNKITDYLFAGKSKGLYLVHIRLDLLAAFGTADDSLLLKWLHNIGL